MNADLTKTPTYSKRYAWYVVLVLTGVYTFNFIDRQILTILQELIKEDLGLTDTQLGLLTGLAFALFYTTLGLPIARYADRSNRKNIVAISLAVWSAMTAISGMAQNFVQLALARVGVGIGEAGGSPPSHAIISDYFPKEKRGTALSVYSMGIFFGIFLGFIVGGVLGKLYGWRIAMLSMGIPGVIYALLVYFTVKEPPKGMADALAKAAEKDLDGLEKMAEEAGQQSMSIGEVARFLFSKRTFVLLAIGSGLHTFATYGVGNFFPSFLARVHEMAVDEIAIWLGITAGFGGMIGTFMGGYLADLFGKKDKRWYIWVSVVAGVLSFLPSYIIMFSPNTQLVLYTTFLTNLLPAIYLGPSLAVTHSLVDARMRAFASAVFFLILNLIGLGLGPLTIGALSDWLQPTFGVESLRYAFAFTFITGTISLACFYFASKSYLKDLGEEL